MSRIGKKLILIPEGVAVSFNDGLISVKGPKGDVSFRVRPEIDVKIENGTLATSVKRDTKNSVAYWGLTRALIANAVKGASDGFEKKLELVGVGYRAKMSGADLSLTLGFSHPIEVKAPVGIKFAIDDAQNILIAGADRQLVGLTAAQIRKLRKPEPYKGKGIRYSGEIVRRKAGKSGKV